MSTLSIGQVAFNHLGSTNLSAWYCRGLELRPSGTTLFGGPPAAKVNGLPHPLFPGRWLTDGRAWFQLEFFRFLSPKPATRRADESPADHGIMNVAIVVRDRATFDATFARWVACGLRPNSPTPLDVGIFRVMYFELPSGQNIELVYPRRWAWQLTGFRPAREEKLK
ncbi:MAG: hypothetical protein VCC00_09190 [Deltaproteobacteria bacterium]